MAAPFPHTITLRGDPIASEARAKAGEDILPGMLVQLDTDGTLMKHATAGEATQAAFAREMDIAGGGIDDAYEDGDTVLYSIFRPGDWVYGFLADEGTVEIGDLLASAGGGALGAVGEGGVAVARALETVDNTGGTGVVRIKVEVL